MGLDEIGKSVQTIGGLNILFILISGAVGEHLAVEAITPGAADYLLKDRLGHLGNAVQRLCS